MSRLNTNVILYYVIHIDNLMFRILVDLATINITSCSAASGTIKNTSESILQINKRVSEFRHEKPEKDDREMVTENMT